LVHSEGKTEATVRRRNKKRRRGWTESVGTLNVSKKKMMKTRNKERGRAV